MNCTELDLTTLTFWQVMNLNLATSTELGIRMIPFMVIAVIVLLIAYSGYEAYKKEGG